MIDWKRLGEILKEEFQRKGLKWTDIQEKVGVASETVSRLFEDPARRKLEILARVAEVLEIPLSELIRRAEEPLPEKEEKKKIIDFEISLCAELQEKVLFPLSQEKEPVWTLRGLKAHVATCPHCQKNLGRLRKKDLPSEEEEIIRFLHFVGAEPVRCPFCGALISQFDVERVLACPQCMSLYVVDPTCETESSSDEIADLVESLPPELEEKIAFEDKVLHNVVPGYCHLKGLNSSFDVRLFGYSDWIEFPHPDLVHLHFFRFKAKEPIQIGNLEIGEGRNVSTFVLTLVPVSDRGDEEDVS